MMEKKREAVSIAAVGEDGDMGVIESDKVAGLPIRGLIKINSENLGVAGEKGFEVWGTAEIDVLVGIWNIVGFGMGGEVGVK